MYRTGLFPFKHEIGRDPIKGAGWSATTRLGYMGEHSIPHRSPEIVILAKNWERAQAALSLMLDSTSLIDGVLSYADDFCVRPENPEEATLVKGMFPLARDALIQTGGLYRAAKIAARASKNKQLAYAISLFRLSAHLHANHPMDLEPGLFPYRQRSLNHRDHTRFAYAIITAYAVIEQLGLALNGEAFKNGQWIPAKRADLEQRLIKAGVDLSDRALWQIRGGKSRLENKRPPKVQALCKWSKHPIRDCEVDIVDALADPRWLRSGVGAHNVKDLADRLSVHEVANAQYLARRLLLARLRLDS